MLRYYPEAQKLFSLSYAFLHSDHATQSDIGVQKGHINFGRSNAALPAPLRILA